MSLESNDGFHCIETAVPISNKLVEHRATHVMIAMNAQITINHIEKSLKSCVS